MLYVTDIIIYSVSLCIIINFVEASVYCNYIFNVHTISSKPRRRRLAEKYDVSNSSLALNRTRVIRLGQCRIVKKIMIDHVPCTTVDLNDDLNDCNNNL